MWWIAISDESISVIHSPLKIELAVREPRLERRLLVFRHCAITHTTRSCAWAKCVNIARDIRLALFEVQISKVQWFVFHVRDIGREIKLLVSGQDHLATFRL